ncbi:MAG: FtsQ-type POTRA domain-containing protein [Candidatus Zixiibacteriota bacterium]
MKKNVGFLIFTSAILLFSGGYIYRFHSPHYDITEIRLTGNRKIGKDEIMQKLHACLGRNVFSLSLKGIETRLKEDLRIRDARVSRMLPGSLLVEIEEKTPVLWINLPASAAKPGDFGFYGLSQDQEIIPLDKSDLSCDLPLVSGIEADTLGGRIAPPPRPYQRWSNFKTQKALEFYSLVRKSDPASLELIAEINLSEAPDVIVYLLPYGNKVMMGQSDFEKKWKRVKAIMSEGEKMENLACMDLRFDDQVLLTMSSKSDSTGGIDKNNHSPNKAGLKPRGRHG